MRNPYFLLLSSKRTISLHRMDEKTLLPVPIRKSKKERGSNIIDEGGESHRPLIIGSLLREGKSVGLLAREGESAGSSVTSREEKGIRF